MRSLRSKLSASFLALSVVAAVGVAFLVGELATRQIERQIGQSMAEISYQIRDKLDRGMFERYRDIQTLAWLTPEVRAAGNPALMRAWLDRVQGSYEPYAWIGFADAEGRVVAATRGMLEGESVAQRPWFQGSRERPFVGDVHEAKLLAKLLPSPSGQPLRFVDVAAPVFAEGRLLGVLGAHLSWEWADEVRRSVLVPFDEKAGVEALILDRDGTVLLGPPHTEGRQFDRALLPAKGWRLIDDGGTDYLTAASPTVGHRTYTGLGWTVVLRQPAALAFAPAQALQQRVLLYGLAMAGLLYLVGHLAARHIAGPLLEIAGAADRMRQGSITVLPPGRGYAEARILSESLAALLRELAEVNQALERRVAERTAYLSAVIDNAAEGILVVAAGRVRSCNRTALRLFGRDEEAMIGLPLTALADTADWSAGHEFMCRRPDGSTFPAEASVSSVEMADGRVEIILLRDITERQQVDRMKSELVSTVSHELRTPLTAIGGSLALVNSGVLGEVTPEVRELTDIAEQSCARLVRLINDLLDVERLASGGLKLERRVLPILELAERAVADNQAFARQYGVTLELAEPVPDALIEGDRDRLLQVLTNLLSNAVKFSPRHAAVTLEVSEPEPGWVRLSVIDRGPGIPEAFRDRIFGRFSQADSSDSGAKGGAGLGLNITKGLVERHGGRVAFDSAPGRGTTFHVDLPTREHRHEAA